MNDIKNDLLKLDKDEKRNLLYLLIIGLLLRIFYIVETSGTPFILHLFSDSKIYYDWAKSLVTVGWTGEDAFFMAPVYPYLMALYMKIFGDSLFIFRVLQGFVSTATIILIYIGGKRFYSTTTGYIAATIATFYSVFIFYSGAILSETYQVFFLTLLIILLLDDSKRLDQKHWFSIGVLLGVSALFRGNILLFAPVAIAWLLIEGKKIFAKNKQYTAAMIFTLGTILPIAPVTAYNYLVSGELVILTTNGGINFFLGNNEDSPGVYLNPTQFNISEDMSGQKYAQRQTGKKLSANEASGYWYGRGIDYILDEPGDALLLYANKFFLFFGEGENPQSTIMDINYFRENYSKILQLPLPGYFLISLLALAGFVFMYSEKQKKGLFFLFIFTYIIATLLFFVNGRYRLGITPALIIVAAYAIIKLFEAAQKFSWEKIKRPAYFISVFLFLYVFFSARPVYSEFDAYIHLGDIEYEAENYNNAVEYYNRALFFQDKAVAYMNMGNALARKKDFRNAIAAYQKAIARDLDNILAHFNLGFAYTQMGSFDLAIKEYSKIIELDPTFANAYRNLGITLYVQELYEEALPYFEKFLTISNDPEVNALVRKDIETIKLKLQSEEKK